MSVCCAMWPFCSCGNTTAPAPTQIQPTQTHINGCGAGVYPCASAPCSCGCHAVQLYFVPVPAAPAPSVPVVPPPTGIPMPLPEPAPVVRKRMPQGEVAAWVKEHQRYDGKRCAWFLSGEEIENDGVCIGDLLNLGWRSDQWSYNLILDRGF